MFKKLIALSLVAAMSLSVAAQNTLTREQILAMSTDELSELSLEELMEAVEILGVSSVDELFAMIMNKNVSSASKEEESAFTSPLSSSVLTRDEIRTYGVTTIEEAMRLIPGMIVSQKVNGVYDVHMRGLNNIPNSNMLLYTENANTLLMIDGRPVQSYAMGGLCFEALPIDIEDVERIEVVRSASSALYGANAVTGVINIITQKPDNAPATVSGSVQMGNLGTVIGNIAYRKAVSDKFAFGVTVNVQHRERPTDKMYIMPQAGLYYANKDTLKIGASYSKAQMGQMLQDGVISDFSNGGQLRSWEVENLRQIVPSGDSFQFYACTEPQSDMKSMFPNPKLARKSEGYNAYVTVKPAADVRFDLQGGYQRSFINTTPITDDYFSFNGRESTTGYANLHALVKGIDFRANYFVGPQNYAYGCPGFKTNFKSFSANLDYTFKLGSLGIRPGLYYMFFITEDYVPVYDDPSQGYEWHYERPGYKFAADNFNHLSGFCFYDSKMTAFAPSIRLDYSVNKFRFIAAYRADKTNVPDQWNHSWQFAANFKANDKNFFRIVYGRANRSATVVSSGCNYTWTRTNLTPPSKLQFLLGEDADLMYADNFEFGYRAQPNDRLLIDAELFYSISQDYGALKAHSAYVSMNLDDFNAIRSAIDVNPAAATPAMLKAVQNIKSIANIKFENLPYKVHQMGVTVNTDWIISNKFIAKLNVNLQKTTIDNYYPYNQTLMLKSLMQECAAKMATEAGQIVTGMAGTTKEQQLAMLDNFKKTYYNPKTNTIDMEPYAVADVIRGVENGTIDKESELAKGVFPQMQDDFEHKATPAFYGMLGLVYKPISQLTVSAFANFQTERRFVTKYSLGEGAKLDGFVTANLKVGYKPMDNVELFFNGHNLFNHKGWEFPYADETGGLYTFGCNFAF